MKNKNKVLRSDWNKKMTKGSAGKILIPYSRSVTSEKMKKFQKITLYFVFSYGRIAIEKIRKKHPNGDFTKEVIGEFPYNFFLLFRKGVESMDICIDVGEKHRLNIRAACVIIHQNKMLVHHKLNKPHYCLLGGRVEIGEDSQTTIKREVLEELGKEIEITKELGIIENFFQMDGKQYHEIMFIYFAEFVNEEDKQITHTLQNCEGKSELQYEWLDLDKIEEYAFLPSKIPEMLKQNTYPLHEIQKDS